MVSRSVLLITLGALIGGAPAAASVPSPTPGVTATQSGNAVTIAFTPQALAAAHLKAGDRIGADCESVKPASGLLLTNDEDATPLIAFVSGKVGADGTVALSFSEAAKERHLGTFDACNVEREDVKTGRSVDVAKVALTPAGAASLEDGAAATALKAALLHARKTGGGYRPAVAVAGVVALPNADASPAAGQVGYWTDGTRAVVAIVTASQRRVFVEDDGRMMVRTNLIQQADTLFYGSFNELAEVVPSGSGDDEQDRGKPPYGADSDPQLHADGIRLSRSGRRVTVRFTGASIKAYKKIAGRKVRLSCVAPPAEQLFPDLNAKTLPKPGVAVVRVPRRGGRITGTLSRAGGDVCVVGDDGAFIAFDGIDAAGRAFVQDTEALELLSDADSGLRPVAAGGQSYRTAAEIAAGSPKRYVALGGRGATPPVGRVGVWTDGGQRLELVAASASGRRFVVADEGAGVVRTNMLSPFIVETTTMLVALFG